MAGDAVADADRAANELRAVIRAGANAAEDALGVVATMITNQVKVLITQNWPPQSAPGAPPHLRTGGLRLSYRWEPGNDGGTPYVVIFSDTETRQPVPPGRPVIYASYIELGTSRLAPRPHFRPAVEMIRPLIPGILGQAWSRGVEGRGAA